MPEAIKDQYGITKTVVQQVFDEVSSYEKEKHSKEFSSEDLSQYVDLKKIERYKAQVLQWLGHLMFEFREESGYYFESANLSHSGYKTWTKDFKDVKKLFILGLSLNLVKKQKIIGENNKFIYHVSPTASNSI